MFTLKKREQGFTIVELLIVIVVIGILAALVITVYSGAQSKTRNLQRTSDVDSVALLLEAYKIDNGHFPSLANLNSATWRTANLKGLETDALVDPSTPCNPETASCLVAAPAARNYAYQPRDDAGASCEADATTCTQFTLTATYEGTVNNKTTAVKKNVD